MAPKPRKSPNDAVQEDGISPGGERPASPDRPISRPSKKDEAGLETYEESARRGGGDDARSELSRRPEDVEKATGGERTARDEP